MTLFTVLQLSGGLSKGGAHFSDRWIIEVNTKKETYKNTAVGNLGQAKF